MSVYAPPSLQKIEVRLTFNPLFRRLGIEWLANIYPELYESFFAFIFPTRDIMFRLKVKKQDPTPEVQIQKQSEYSNTFK